MPTESTIEIIATSAFGLETIVRHELRALGYESSMLEPGRQVFRSDPLAIARANMFLRCAERVLIRVGHFEAADFDQLFEGTKALPWEQWLPADAAFPVKAKSIRSQLTSIPAVQRTVKKSIVERLSQAYTTDTLPETGPTFTVEAALYNNQLTLTLDSSGTGLHKRGYRPAAGMAPLRETLAAAMIQLARWNPELPFLDPFCGSGTLAIEAAMLGRQIAPGSRREFVSEGWPSLPARVWLEARTEAKDLVKPPLEQRLLGTDVDGRVLAKARSNAAAAGVADDAHFQVRDFSALTSNRKYGCLICNPPYGHRLESNADQARALDALYRSFPLVLRRLPTWSHYILTSMPGFEAIIGQSASKRRKLFNGRIECQFYQFFGPRPQKRHLAGQTSDAAPAEPVEPVEPVSVEAVPGAAPVEAVFDTPPVEADPVEQIAVVPVTADADNSSPRENDSPGNKTTDTAEAPRRPKHLRVTAGKQAFGGLHEAALRQSEEFANRLRKRSRHLRRWPNKGVHCYRLYEKDVPDVPLVVDRYEDWLHMAEFARPHERSQAENADWLDLMKRTAAEALDIEPNRVAMKRRQRQRKNSQYQRVDELKNEFPVRERELNFLVNLTDYLDTGLFLDHRETRRMVGEQAQGKDVLNLFAYTGSFSVYAAAGGANSTRTIDLSAKYLDWAKRNFALNGISTGDKHRFVQADAMTYMRDLHQDVTFDLAVVDPPTFSNSKDLKHDWEVQRDHVALLAEVGKRIRPGGVVFFSTNFRRFKFQPEAWPFAEIHEISRQTVPEDFRNRRIHRCWRLIR